MLHVGLLDGNLLKVRHHLLVGLNVLGIAVDARCAEQLQVAFLKLVLQYGRGAEQCALLVEELVDALNHEHGILQLANLGGHALHAVVHLALILGVGA